MHHYCTWNNFVLCSLKRSYSKNLNIHIIKTSCRVLKVFCSCFYIQKSVGYECFVFIFGIFISINDEWFQNLYYLWLFTDLHVKLISQRFQGHEAFEDTPRNNITISKKHWWITSVVELLKNSYCPECIMWEDYCQEKWANIRLNYRHRSPLFY